MSSNFNSNIAFNVFAWLATWIVLCQSVLAKNGYSETPESEVLTYEKDVRPIFKAHCFHCHGEEPELAGGIDTRLVRLIAAGGDSGPALIHGDASRSLIWKRIDADEMPKVQRSWHPKRKRLSDSG